MRTILGIMLLAIAAACRPVAAQEIYRCPHRDGAAVFTAEPDSARCERAASWQPEPDPARVESSPPPLSAAETGRGAVAERSRRVQAVTLQTTAFAREIALNAARFGVPEHLVRAVIHAESTFNPRARSAKGAMGLMQLMPATARRFGVREAYDPAQNIAGGVQYLAWLLQRFKGDWRLAIAGYNAGEAAVDRHRGVPPFRETREYLAKVWRLSQSYAVQSGI